MLNYIDLYKLKKENLVILYLNSGIYYRFVFEKGCNNINICLLKCIFFIKGGGMGVNCYSFK